MSIFASMIIIITPIQPQLPMYLLLRHSNNLGIVCTGNILYRSYDIVVVCSILALNACTHREFVPFTKQHENYLAQTKFLLSYSNRPCRIRCICVAKMRAFEGKKCVTQIILGSVVKSSLHVCKGMRTKDIEEEDFDQTKKLPTETIKFIETTSLK